MVLSPAVSISGRRGLESAPVPVKDLGLVCSIPGLGVFASWPSRSAELCPAALSSEQGSLLAPLCLGLLAVMVSGFVFSLLSVTEPAECFC